MKDFETEKNEFEEVAGKRDKILNTRKNAVPVADKALLTLEEAGMYFNIGVNKIRELTSDDHCPYVLWNGSKRLIKRELFKEYLYKQYSI